MHSLDANAHTKQQQLDALKAQIAATLATTPSSSAVDTVANRLTAVSSVAQQRLSWDGFMGALSRVIPEDVWVISLEATSVTASTGTTGAPTVATPGALPSGFTITGYTYSQPSVARMMQRLALVPWLSDVSLTSSVKQAFDNRTVFQFTIAANVVSLPEVGS